MDWQVNAFWQPKIGAADAEYEDAYWCGPGPGGADGRPCLRVIIADGASESLLAGRWARHLTEVFGTAPEDIGTAAGFTAAYRRAAASWESVLAAYVRERADRNSPIQWYEEPGLARGAHSTLLAAEFRRSPDGEGAYWVAAALGDSCLFQVRWGELRDAVPVYDSAAFSNQPALLSSGGTAPEVLGRHLTIKAGDLRPGDTCYLATDALSAWFLRMAETGESWQEPWRPLRFLDDGEQFSELIGKLRGDGAIRDDDTTLVRVDVDQ
jgi:Protein phosphatase 2C